MKLYELHIIDPQTHSLTHFLTHINLQSSCPSLAWSLLSVIPSIFLPPPGPESLFFRISGSNSTGLVIIIII